jgi:uncharacterized membrane protein (UPF0136 family)
MSWQGIVWGYITLLVAGGLIGYLKAGSKASIIASGSIAAILALLLLAKVDVPLVELVLALLGVYFGIRFSKTRKLMPGGIFTFLSFASAAAVYFLARR